MGEPGLMQVPPSVDYETPKGPKALTAGAASGRRPSWGISGADCPRHTLCLRLSAPATWRWAHQIHTPHLQQALSHVALLAHGHPPSPVGWRAREAGEGSLDREKRDAASLPKDERDTAIALWVPAVVALLQKPQATTLHCSRSPPLGGSDSTSTPAEGASNLTDQETEQ